MKNVTLERDLGSRCFVKPDGNLYVTVPTGLYGEDGNPTYVDKMVSSNQLDAQGALTATEYREVDEVVTEEANNPDRLSVWMRNLGDRVVKTFDGMSNKVYWYRRAIGKTVSRSTMDLEDDAPQGTLAYEEDGVPLPLEFADWLTNIRRDPTASRTIGRDVAAEKALLATQGVAVGNDLRQLNGWDGLTYRGMSVYGWRDVPTGLSVVQSGVANGGGWLNEAVTPANIYSDICKMVKLANTNKIEGPFALLLPDFLRFRFAEIYSTSVNNVEKTLWQKLQERPAVDVPNILDLQVIKFVKEMNETKGGGTPTVGEAYLTSLNPKWFRTLYYLPMQSFTIDLKGMISTKHRIVEGVCPLFKKDGNGTYGVVKLAAPTGS